MKFSGTATVKEITHLSDRIYSLTITCPEIASNAGPGQFIQVKIADRGYSIWPRPFSIHHTNDNDFVITVKKYGTITEKMSHLKPGDSIDLTGPLGNCFTLPAIDKNIFLIAGGVGLPPLHHLCLHMLKGGHEPSRIHFFSGSRSKDELFAESEIREMGVNYTVATDDGTFGITGYVTEPFEVELIKLRTSGKAENIVVYSCGPEVMMKRVAEICEGIECYLSLEQLMPCGWGVCNGCAVKLKPYPDQISEDKRDYRLERVCREGPVFDASEIIWE